MKLENCQKEKNAMKGRILPSFFAAALLLGVTGGLASATCTATGFYVDGTNMTAAEINPGSVTGTVTATGCNIGIYYDDGTDGGAQVGGTVSGATVSGANYFGILANGGGGHAAVTVNISNSTVEGIGETPINGDQHGNAIFYINASTDTSADDSRTCSNAAGASTNGTISGNIVNTYQKNGITAKCSSVSVIISGNTVTGADETFAIAQNGIELGQGATGSNQRQHGHK
jgi:hypothetical protein